MDAQETLRLARKRLECVTTGLECVGATRQPGTTGHKDVAYVQHHAADLGRLLDQLAWQLTPRGEAAAPAERNGKPQAAHVPGCVCMVCVSEQVAAKLAADRAAKAAPGCGVPGCPTCASKQQLAEEVSVTAILFGRPGPTAARHDRGFTKPTTAAEAEPFR